MANDKKMVEAYHIHGRDFAQWYTDVVKRPSCAIAPA